MWNVTNVRKEQVKDRSGGVVVVGGVEEGELFMGWLFPWRAFS